MLLATYTAQPHEAGLDEAGRGCLAGPVFAAAVILPPGFSPRFLNDSKQLTARRREALRPEICAAAVAWAVGQASVAEIGELNIAQASYLAMHRAVAALAVPPTHLLVDGNRFWPLPGVAHTCVVGGDGLSATSRRPPCWPKRFATSTYGRWPKSFRPTAGSKTRATPRRGTGRHPGARPHAAPPAGLPAAVA